jgi:hypothetical protein
MLNVLASCCISSSIICSSEKEIMLNSERFMDLIKSVKFELCDIILLEYV